MDPIAKVLSERGDTLAEVAELLYGDGAWEFVSKKSTKEQRERTQARIGLATNVVGLTAGIAGTGEAYRQYKDARTEASGKKPYIPKHMGTGRIRGFRPIASASELLAKHPTKVAAAGLGLQVGNIAGDAIANRVLARSAKKDVSKGIIREAKNTIHNADRASASMANSAERIERALPSKKKLGVYTGGTLAALAGSQYAATYYGTKHGNERQIGGVVGRAPKKAVKYGLRKIENGSVKKSFDWNSTFEISKVDTDKRQVFGWASVITMDGNPVVDLQDDYMAMETIEKAAYDYVKSSRKGGDMHRRNGAEPHHVSDMIESFVVTDEKKEKLGLPPEFPTGWLVGFQVNDDDTWKLVKDGKRTQFSIHGSGQRVEKVLD